MSANNQQFQTLQELYEDIRHKDLSKVSTQSTYALKKTLEKSAEIHKRINDFKSRQQGK